MHNGSASVPAPKLSNLLTHHCGFLAQVIQRGDRWASDAVTLGLVRRLITDGETGNISVITTYCDGMCSGEESEVEEPVEIVMEQQRETDLRYLRETVLHRLMDDFDVPEDEAYMRAQQLKVVLVPLPLASHYHSRSVHADNVLQSKGKGEGIVMASRRMNGSLEELQIIACCTTRVRPGYNHC